MDEPNRELTSEDEPRLVALLDRVFGVWAKKSPEVRPAYEFREARFELFDGIFRSANGMLCSAYLGIGLSAMHRCALALLRERSRVRFSFRLGNFMDYKYPKTLVYMTQRDRLDAFLAENAAAAGWPLQVSPDPVQSGAQTRGGWRRSGFPA